MLGLARLSVKCMRQDCDYVQEDQGCFGLSTIIAVGLVQAQTVKPEEIEAVQKSQYDEIERYLDREMAQADQVRATPGNVTSPASKPTRSRLSPGGTGSGSCWAARPTRQPLNPKEN